jgi:hypothetical protein
MKCFERLVMAHINTISPETLEPLQFAYRPNRSTDDAISIALHTALSYLDKRNTYVRMLFIDYSSAFNTILHPKLITKLWTKEMIVDYRKWRTEHAPMLIDGAVVEQVESFKFLGVHITNKLSWSKHTKTVMKRA